MHAVASAEICTSGSLVVRQLAVHPSETHREGSTAAMRMLCGLRALAGAIEAHRATATRHRHAPPPHSAATPRPYLTTHSVHPTRPPSTPLTALTALHHFSTLLLDQVTLDVEPLKQINKGRYWLAAVALLAPTSADAWRVEIGDGWGSDWGAEGWGAGGGAEGWGSGGWGADLDSLEDLEDLEDLELLDAERDDGWEAV